MYDKWMEDQKQHFSRSYGMQYDRIVAS